MSIWSRIERRFEEIAGDLYPDEFREKLDLAKKALEESRLEQAKSWLTELHEERPEHLATMLYLGLTELRLDHVKTAQALFDKVLEKDSNLAIALVARGDASLQLEEPKQATTFYQKAIRSAQGDASLLAAAYHGMGQSYRKVGELNKAIRELRKAVAEAPKDSSIVASLGEALQSDVNRSNYEARLTLERLSDKVDCPIVALSTLGKIALQDEDPIVAFDYFQRIVIRKPAKEILADGYLGVAQATLMLEDSQRWGAAQTAIEQSLALNANNPDTYFSLGTLQEKRQEHSKAMESYERALAFSSSENSLFYAKAALKLALQTGETESGVRFANLILSSEPNNPDALSARGIELWKQSKIPAARATFKEATQNPDCLEAWLALAQLEQEEEEYTKAAEYARTALRLEPDNQRAMNILATAGAAALGVCLLPTSDWYDLARATQRLCSAHLSLQTLQTSATNAINEYDQPLLVAVMGEFSSGKSSFVNAFIGSEVAPTGITPTTATINILKYGRERSARIVYRDNTNRLVSEQDLNTTLSQISEAEARRVQHVELLMPLDILQQVNIVDTPGLNSILPEHEAVARTFLTRADAVIWLFTANQAGKSTEKTALASIGKEGVRVLGVLNKIDQLEEPQIQDVLSYVKEEIGDQIECCLPISTRESIANPENVLWNTLRQELELRFFSHARELKKQALGRRLETILHTVEQTSSGTRVNNNRKSDSFSNAAIIAQTKMTSFLDSFVTQERSLLQKNIGLLYKNAAKEVLELIRPRKLPFGSHSAKKADRDYLLGLLDSGYDALLVESKSRCETSLDEATLAILSTITNDLTGQERQEVHESVVTSKRLLDAQVWQSCNAFLRGYMRGGFVDHFFQVEIAKIQLTENNVYHALFKAAPLIDREFSMPLARYGADLFSQLSLKLEAFSHAIKLENLEIDAGLEQAISILRKHKKRLENELLQRSDQ